MALNNGKKKYSEEVQRLLLKVVDHFDKEDVAVRQRQIRTYRRLKLLWEGFRNVYYSEVAHDWRIPDLPAQTDDSDQSYYDKPINVLRALLETVIAALSVTIPPIKCFPDDAENTLDLLAAKAGDQICKLIFRHNNVELLWLHSLYVFCTEGMVACYNYPKSSKVYGQYEEDVTENEDEIHDSLTCPICGFEINDDIMESGAPEVKEQIQEICPNCLNMVDLSFERTILTITKTIRTELKNKTRMCLESYGGLYVKVPTYARRQEDCPYLSYSYETHFVNAIEKITNEELIEKLRGKPQGIYDPYEAWGRLSPQYLGEYPINNVTCRYFWFRPCAFDVLQEAEAKHLKRLFPDGACVFMVNDCYADAYPERLDDRWTLTFNPFSDYLQHDPLGLLLVSIQEITNDLFSLTLQTVEHGIGQTFVDPKVVNLAAYRQMETVPGGLYPAKPAAGKSLSDGFFEVKTATLGQEVLPFGQQVQTAGQFISGAAPPLFGGILQEQKTASGQSMDKAAALQRLGNTWKMFKIWWKEIFSKAIPQYVEGMKDDEKDVQLDTNGNFKNIWIRRAELEGKIGKVELEASENLPITWAQRKDLLFQLLQSPNPEVLQMLGAPENLTVLREALGLDDFFIPGEDDRNKQYEEIRLMMDAQPILMPPTVDPMSLPPEAMQDPAVMQQTQPQEVSSVDVDPDIDNHQIEFEICRNWLVSDVGRTAKFDKPEGYRNVLLHAKAHLQFIRMAAMQEAMMQAGPTEGKGAVPKEKPKETDKEAPISGEQDVHQSF